MEIETDKEEVEMDMTPMIDVVFLLIIFFMLVTTFSNQILDGGIILPVASEAMTDEVGKRLVINVNSDGLYTIMGQKLKKEAIKAKVASYAQLKRTTFQGMDISDQKVMIRADQETPYRYIQDLYFILGEQTVWKIAFATLKER